MTEEQVIQAILIAMSTGEEGVTVPDIARAMNKSDDTVRYILRQLKEAGKIRVVQFRRKQLDDVVRTQRGYALVKS
jgi:Mn-dependent DtxR family transcriptional regulator